MNNPNRTYKTIHSCKAAAITLQILYSQWYKYLKNIDLLLELWNTGSVGTVQSSYLFQNNFHLKPG